METIFIHETDESIRDVLTIIFNSEGYQVKFFERYGDWFLRSLSTNPSLVILDFKLTGEVSIAACQLIRHRYPYLPVLAMSCNERIGDLYLRHGFDDYILKPFDVTELLSVVRRMISTAKISKHKTCTVTASN